MNKKAATVVVASLLAVSCGTKKLNVPKEPATAKKILTAKNDAELQALNEVRYLGVHVPDELDVIMIGWDVVYPGDKKLDYVTVRRYKTQKRGDGKVDVIIEEFPVLYYVDFDNNAEEDGERMYAFKDEDADGDPSNAKLVRDPRKSRP